MKTNALKTPVSNLPF